jgi:glucosamine--fructose-6-phosphate aminotransferase (isomerizing)
MVDNRNVYIVSISGSTKANVLAAQAAIRRGAKTTAITARTSSKLAKACDQVVELKYRCAGVTTAGTISFTTSMLACIALTRHVRIPLYIDRIYRQAASHAEQIVDKIGVKASSYLMLGNGILYPIARYGALKFNEVFGSRSLAYPAEEFCHSPLFSIGKTDNIILMGTERDGSSKLNERLNREGLSSFYVDFGSTQKAIELLLHSTFFVQLLILKLARKRRIINCYFLNNDRLLKISSDFIYD